ncbi:MAG TPA: flagellar export chaperone FliS [Clostridia bacterium]|jgi:flagellar protein FliS|nr:flagellar export chaperone FliS [Clostridiaceae bacterium]HOA31796.1 flagellar export chaperone FliS [Clostridia bacterium]HPZ52154.1 flagellar export chaperone FliS [Clostridia bacterium]
MAVNPYQKYKTQAIMTASPGDLTLMLYDGCIKQMNLALLHIEENNHELKNNAIQKAEAILTELMSTLDMSYELSNNLFQIYEYVYRLLILANISNDTEKLNEAINRITEIRDAWEEAIKIERKVAYDNTGDGA